MQGGTSKVQHGGLAPGWSTNGGGLLFDASPRGGGDENNAGGKGGGKGGKGKGGKKGGFLSCCFAPKLPDDEEEVQRLPPKAPLSGGGTPRKAKITLSRSEIVHWVHAHSPSAVGRV